MKKKHVQLGKKLILGKETIANLDNGAQGEVLGGAATNPACITQQASCWSNCASICVVCGTFGPNTRCCPTDTTPALCY